MRSILGILPGWLRRWVDVGWKAVKAWIDDGGPRLGASIAFYSIFALAPLLVIAIAIAGAVFGEEAARGQIVQQIRGLVGETAARGIETLIQSASQKETSVWTSIVGFFTLLLGASGVFVEMKNAFDTMWKPEKPASGLTVMLRARLTAIGLVLGFGFLAIASLLLSALLAGLAAYFGGLIPGAEAIAAVLDVVVSTAVLTLAFAALIYFLPSAKIRPRAVWVGALASAVLFAIGKHIIGLYLGRASVASSYGAAGSFVVVILWVYYSSQILLVGAEVTSVLDGKRRDDKPSDEKAVAEPAPGQRARAPSGTQRA
jgi:membrane protein